MIKQVVLNLLAIGFLTSCKASFFKVVSSSYAKEYCSCRFVVQQSKEYCHKYALQIVPVSNYSENITTKIVKADAIGFSSSAIFQNTRLGCKLIN